MYTDKMYHSDIERIRAVERGEWVLIKEYQMWGDCPTFKNYESGQVLFKYNNSFLDWEQLKAKLKENWRPVASEEKEWFINNLK